MKKVFQNLFILVPLFLLLSACGGGGSKDSNNARLADLQLSTGVLDQIFQSTQFDYTASVSHLTTRLKVTASTEDEKASGLTINGTPVSSGVPSGWINLVEGANTIDIVVMAEDGVTTRAYQLIITRLGLQESLSKLIAADGSSTDYFGVSVSLSGDGLAVGAYSDGNNNGNDAGSVYVYTRSGGVWSYQGNLIAIDGAAGDYFGRSVSLDGDSLAVGAYQHDANNLTGSGSVYVFTRSGTSWSQQAKLIASDAAVDDQFGISVSLDGDSLAVGAWLDDDIDTSSGSVYVFTRSGTLWSQQAKLTATDGAAGDWFGWSVSLDGDSLAVGAYQHDANNLTSSGSVYVFTRSGTSWSEQAKLTAGDGVAGNDFGYSVSLDGDSLAAGAIYGDGNDTNSGAVYVFTRNGGLWSQQVKLTAADGAIDDRFGFSLSLDGDSLAVGASLDDDNSLTDSGSVYFYARSGTTWSQQAKLTATDGAVEDRLGGSVSLDGDSVAVGAAYGDGNYADTGMVYVFK